MAATESLFNFENHVLRCRCCLRQFEIDDTQIKITQIVQLRFQELTQMIVSLTAKCWQQFSESAYLPVEDERRLLQCHL